MMMFITLSLFFSSLGGILLTIVKIPLISLIGYAPAIFCIFNYAAKTYRFWEVNAEPKNKAWVYLYSGLGYLILGGFCWGLWSSTGLYDSFQNLVLEVGLEIQLENQPHILGLSSALPFFFAAAYQIYIYWRVLEVKKRRYDPKKEQEEQIKKFRTGRFASKAEISNAKCHDRNGFFVGQDEKNRPIFIKDPVHAITYGGPGSGKTIGTVVPNILNWPGSLFVSDPKGELAVMTSDHRRSMGQEVVFLNPWELFGVKNTPFNPLQIIIDDIKNSADKSLPKSSALVKKELDDSRAIAQILVTDPPIKDQNDWVRAFAREILQAFMLYLGLNYPHTCSLVGLRSALKSNEEDLIIILENMCRSTHLNGEMALMGNSLARSYNNEPQQFANCMSEAIRSVEAFSHFGKMGTAISSKAKFKMEQFASQPTTIYLTLPGEYREAYKSWLSLVVTTAVESVGRRKSGNEPILFMLDEFANLGLLPTITKGLAEYRGSGFRGWLIVQSREQLKALYKDKAEDIENQCDIHQILSCSLEHAKKISERLGKDAVIKKTGSTAESFDKIYTSKDGTWSVETKPLMEPPEITSMQDEQIVFLKGCLRWPLKIKKSKFWNILPWRNQVNPSPLEGSIPPTSRKDATELPKSKSHESAIQKSKTMASKKTM